jgi:hypothetical protein
MVPGPDQYLTVKPLLLMIIKFNKSHSVTLSVTKS